MDAELQPANPIAMAIRNAPPAASSFTRLSRECCVLWRKPSISAKPNDISKGNPKRTQRFAPAGKSPGPLVGPKTGAVAAVDVAGT